MCQTEKGVGRHRCSELRLARAMRVTYLACGIDGRTLRHEPSCTTADDLSDTQRNKAPSKPEAAMCVRNSSARRVLQFTPFIAASCVLHRPASRVIHRLQLYCMDNFQNTYKVLAYHVGVDSHCHGTVRRQPAAAARNKSWRYGTSPITNS
jgi:hypothetical protein